MSRVSRDCDFGSNSEDQPDHVGLVPVDLEALIGAIAAPPIAVGSSTGGVLTFLQPLEPPFFETLCDYFTLVVGERQLNGVHELPLAALEIRAIDGEDPTVVVEQLSANLQAELGITGESVFRRNHHGLELAILAVVQELN